MINQRNAIIGDDETDPFYIGSQLYLQSPGFYNWDSHTPSNCATTLAKCGFRSRKPVPGWPYLAARDVNHSQADIAGGIPGSPGCGEWWETTQNDTGGQPLALKTKLLNSVEASQVSAEDWDTDDSAMDNIGTMIENGWAGISYSTDDLEKLVITRYVDQDRPQGDFIDNSLRGTDAGLMAAGGVGGAATGAALMGVTSFSAVALAGYAAIDVANSLKDFYLTMFILKSAAPMAQAVILMMLYGLMIFYLVMAEYEIDSIIIMTFVILAIRFFTPLWDIADYLDVRLFAAMYPDPFENLGTVFTQGINRLMLDMVLTATYVVVPTILFMVVGMAAAKAGKAAKGADGISPKTGTLNTSKMGNIPKPGGK